MSERKLNLFEWLLIGVGIVLVALFLLGVSGCQWSAYNSVTVDPNDGIVQRVGIGTIEVLVIDSKKGLAVRTWEGTTVNLAETNTDPDEQAMLVLAEAIEQWLLMRPEP